MDKDERIRKRAHEIWIEAGRPEGEDLKHWAQASEELKDKTPQSALSENLSVFGSDPTPASKKATKSKLNASAGPKRPTRSAKSAPVDQPAPEITTGRKPARKTIRKIEGP